MASRNLKPKNSSDSEGETEWTFIDSDEGTIETNKDCVTYRKPTYSEILKGVVAEDLVEEVESEPEFEVLASFKFRPKGESFGLGSSASKAAKNAEAQGKESKQEDDESPSGDNLSSSDDGIMIISSNAIEASTSKAPSHASDNDDCNKIDETDTVGYLNDEIKDNKAYTGEDVHDDDDDGDDGDGDDDFNKMNKTNTVGSLNDGIIDNMAYTGEDVHDDDDDDDFVIADESESDFEEATMDDTAEPDDENNDDHDDSKQGVESDEEELSESTANTLNASTANDESHDEDSNSDDGLLGIHKGGICDNPGKGLDWDSLTFQLLSTLPRMSDSVTTLGDDSQNPNLQDSMTESSHDSDSEKNSHSSYAAVSQDDSSSFDELSDPADVNRDLHSEPMIPRWLYSADKKIKDTVESFDDDSDYNISDIEELDFEEGTLIPQWFYDPSHKVEVDESVDEEIVFIDSDIDKLDVLEKDDSPSWLYNPSHRVEDLNDVEDPNPIVPRWIFDPNYKIPDFDETYAGDTDYSGSDYEWETDDDDLTTLPGWLFDKNIKPPIYEDDEEGFAWPSQLFVDIPTFIILLCLTTALGFSIGHGLTLYFASQGTHGNAKLQDIQAPKQFPSPLEDLGLTAEEIAKIDLLRLEDELEQQKDADMLAEHLRFDLRELYKSLKEKHHRLLRSQKNTEDRLHISKTMSWYWRMKYDEEKRRNEVEGVPKNLRLKNFSDMANLARKTKLAKKWRRLYKKNDTARLEKSSPLNANLKWLFNLSKAALIQHKRNSSRYLMKAMALLKKNDMKKFRNRWTHDSKELKEKSCTSHPNKRIQIKRKAAISSPFGWVNSTQKCKRVDRSDILGRCLIKQSPLVQNKCIKPTISKPAKKNIRKKTNYLQARPCLSKPANDNKRKKPLKKKVTSFKKIRQKPRKKSARRANKEEKVLKERIKKRELKKKAIEIKNQVDELKAVLTELRRERRRAEIEKAKLELSWRKLKRQRLAFEKERKKKKKNDKKKVKKVKSKLRREKARLKTWKNVVKRAQKKAQALRKDLRRVSAAKQELKDIKHIKKGLKLEKRKLREQQKNLKSLKQQVRKEHRNYARERWKTKKKRRELEKQGFSKSETMEEKSYKAKKQEKKNTNHYRNTDQPSTEHSQYEKKKKKKKKHKAQKKFWENLEKSLYHWAEKVNKTIQSHRHGKAGKIWSKLRRQFDRFVSWTTGKSSQTTVPKKKTKKEHPSKTKVKMKNPVFEKILAEQMKYDEEKRNRQKDSENQWKSKGPVVMKKKKKERKKKDPKILLRQEQRKERRKYQRELERLQQWALQMNEKKLEHERIYRKKEKKTRKCFKSRKRNPKPSTEKGATEERDSFSSSRALVSVGDSNSTLMLLLQPRITTPADYERPKTNSKQTPESQDQESVIRGITKSQINHELEKKKTDTSLAVPLVDDVIKLPDDVSKGIDVTSFDDKSYHSQEPTPPSLGPTFYKDFPILRIIDEEKRKKDGSVSVADILSARSLPKGPENVRDGESGQRSEPWYMRRAEQRDHLRDTNPALTMFPRPIGPLKSDGTWFFHRSSDRALQRELYEPLNRQSARDEFQNSAWRSYFHRGGRRSETNDGKWVFERASNRAEQRSNNEPWYMRRADGREEDREESKDSWFVERGFERDMLHDYDEDDDEYDDFMNDYDYDDYADRSYDKYKGPWL